MNYYKQGIRHAIRKAFGAALTELAGKDKRIVALSADLGGSLKLDEFKEKYPDRFYNTGVAEQNMIGIAAGLSMRGFIPFAGTFGCFLGRVMDHVRQAVLHNSANVKIVGSHGGVSNAKDGPSAHALEDIAFFRALPSMAIVVPSDSNQTLKAVKETTYHNTSVYLRLYREPLPVFTDEKTPFKIGKANLLKQGSDITLISCGPHVGFCLQAARELESNISVEVIDSHTIKPIDIETIVKSAAKTGKVITIEDHNVDGGLGSAVAEVLSEHQPTLLKRLGFRSFATTGDYHDVLRKYHLDTEWIKKEIMLMG